MAQASTQTDLGNNVVENVPKNVRCCSHGGGVDSQTPVLVELLQVSPSEEPESILRLFIRLEEIHNLGLVDDRVFVTRVLPLVLGSLLTFLGGYLLREGNLSDCKTLLLDEYFPYFVRERMIRYLIVFNFLNEGQPLPMYIEQVFGLQSSSNTTLVSSN
jgi:hypothetical protein